MKQTLATQIPETHKEKRYCMICGVNHEAIQFNGSWLVACPRVEKNRLIAISGIDRGRSTLEVLPDGRWRAVSVKDRK